MVDPWAMLKLILPLLLLFQFSYAQDSERDFKSQAATQSLALSLGITNPQAKMQLMSDQVVVDGERESHQIRLYQEFVGPTDLLINGPVGFTSSGKSYTTLFVTAGFLSGKDSIKLIPDAEDKVLVGYEYPANPDSIKKDPSIFLKTIHIVPGQIALSLEWLLNQSYVRKERFHVMGVSLGSLFLPVSLHLAQLRNVHPTSTLLCFGGADLSMVIDHMIDPSVNPLLREISKNLVAGITALHDPRLHLPYLTGTFFTVYATEDSIFPTATSVEQFDLLPSPKEIHWVQGPHIDVNEPNVIYQTLIYVREFLKKFE